MRLPGWTGSGAGFVLGVRQVPGANQGSHEGAFLPLWGFLYEDLIVISIVLSKSLEGKYLQQL